LIEQTGLNKLSTKSNLTPYRSGCPVVDSISNTHKLLPAEHRMTQQKYRSIVGSLIWLSLKSLEDLGILFNSEENMNITSFFIHFPVVIKSLQVTADANWGPQDQSLIQPNTSPPEFDLFKTRSLSGNLITPHGPIHWNSKRQKITSRSSCEAEIYATDECVKDILHLRHIIQDLDLQNDLLTSTTKIYNDNMACVLLWSKNLTTKGPRYLQIRENAIIENKDKIDIQHNSSQINPVDIFSKEDKDPSHFIKLRDSMIHSPLPKDLVRYTAKVTFVSKMTLPPNTNEELNNN